MTKFIVDITLTETRQLEINAPDSEAAQDFAQSYAEDGGLTWDNAEVLDQVIEVDNIEDIDMEEES